ncbi:hypothetical protein BJ684DRAFT_17113 [Piptocephalis cylindrospora]|uniref:Yeast cell wall synthesis Kre9/Knh1-like N-terminal domain-containing protein n=1 Tax=Piptocephalis cylindrospora TaxID=1907219 RepID=A0A4P9Y2T9_9FUNG|nr:hypothetical protein BJ684DRAFT_17113 [Piptocephalis cylindrospora]|eukprot:RKP12391.1 hypothetical protein BJ684DRAFT_17113 [Piptocephalis cylindrospora]
MIIPALTTFTLLLVTAAKARGANVFTITEPTAASYWVSGTPVSINWSIDPAHEYSNNTTVKLELWLGNAPGGGVLSSASAGKIVTTIGGLIPATAGSVAWTAPWAPEVSNNYYIRLERNKQKEGLKALFERVETAESPRFRIEPSPSPSPGSPPVPPPQAPPITGPGNATLSCETAMRAECSRLNLTYAGECHCGSAILSQGSKAQNPSLAPFPSSPPLLLPVLLIGLFLF